MRLRAGSLFTFSPAQPGIPRVVLDGVQLPDAHAARAHVGLPLGAPLDQVEVVGAEDATLAGKEGPLDVVVTERQWAG